MRLILRLVVCGVFALAASVLGTLPQARASSDPATDVAAAQFLMKMQEYDGAASIYAELLKRPDYEENDPERIRWLLGYSNARYLKKDLHGARVALLAALAILTIQGGRTDPSAVLLLGPLAVIERELGNGGPASGYCAELVALQSRVAKGPGEFADTVSQACPGVALPVEPLLDKGEGEWTRAAQIAAQLGIQTSDHKRNLVRSAALWVNIFLGHDSPLKVSPSWVRPRERSESDTVAIILTSKHNAKGSGAFVPVEVERAIILEESFLKALQLLPPNAIPGWGFQIEEVHILVLVLLHEFAHSQARDQIKYGTASCKERNAMERQADLFVAKTLRAALLGERGVIAQVAAGRTVRSLIGLGWQYTSNRSLQELFPDSMKDDPHARARAYCEGGPWHPAMELRMLELYRTILGSEYAAMFGEDTLSQLVTLFKQKAMSLPTCGCLP